MPDTWDANVHPSRRPNAARSAAGRQHDRAVSSETRRPWRRMRHDSLRLKWKLPQGNMTSLSRLRAAPRAPTGSGRRLWASTPPPAPETEQL
jgi:hypothetical protein